MEGWALTVAVLAFLVSAAALLIAWWQLVLQRDAAGGRGIIFEVHRPHHKEARIGGEVFVTDEYYVLVKLVGNDLHEAAVHLERHGRPLQFGDRGYIDETPETLHRFTCEDEPLIWEFELSPTTLGTSAVCSLGLLLTVPVSAPMHFAARSRRLSSSNSGIGFDRFELVRGYRAGALVGAGV